MGGSRSRRRRPLRRGPREGRLTRIALVWPNFQATNACGVRGRAFAKHYARLGAQVLVLAPDQPGIHDETPGYEVRGLPLLHDAGDLASMPKRDRILRDALRGFAPDVVHASTPSILTAWQAARAARRLGIPWVADVRDLFAESWRAAFGRKLKYDVLERYMEKPLYNTADAVLVMTELQGERLRELYGVPADRVHIASNGAELDHFAEAHAKDADKDVDVLFLGTLGDRGRRGDELVQAYARILERRPGTTFRFVGWDDTPHARAIVKQMEDARVAPHVDLVGRIPHKDVPAHLARARLGVVPVANEPIFRTSMGAKTYEYLAAGLPLAVLGPDGDTELRRVVEREHVGVYASEWEAYADAVADVLADDARLARAARAARALAPRYDRGRIAEDVYEGVLEPLGRGERPRSPIRGASP